MGYKIWMNNKNEWSLAFDIIFDTKEKADERINELKAAYHEKVLFNEISFHAYPEDIKISKTGNIIDKEIKKIIKRKPKKRKRRNIPLPKYSIGPAFVDSSQ